MSEIRNSENAYQNIMEDLGLILERDTGALATAEQFDDLIEDVLLCHNRGVRASVGYPDKKELRIFAEYMDSYGQSYSAKINRCPDSYTSGTIAVNVTTFLSSTAPAVVTYSSHPQELSKVTWTADGGTKFGLPVTTDDLERLRTLLLDSPMRSRE